MATEKTFRAITEVHITTVPGKPGDKSKGIAATPPKVTVIPAKQKFTIDADSDVCKSLLRSNAIQPVKDDDEGKNPQRVVVEKGTAPKKAAAPGKAAPKAPAKADAKADAKDAAKDEGGDEGKGDDGNDMV